MVEKAFFSILSNDTDVAALVAARIYPHHRPQKVSGTELPALTMGRIGTDRLRAGNGLVQARVAVDSWDNCYADVKTLADKVRLALELYRGTAESINIQVILIDGEDEESMPQTGGSENWLYGITQEFQVWYYETAPTN